MNTQVKKKIELGNLVFVARNGRYYMQDINTREVTFMNSECFKLIEELCALKKDVKEIR